MRMRKPAYTVLLVVLLVCLSGCTVPADGQVAPDWMWPSEPDVQVDGEGTPVSAGLTYSTNGDGTCSVQGMGSCKDSELIIPPVSPTGDRVVCIAAQAFAGCTELRSVVLPDGLTQIGDAAFSGCDRLALITVPDSLRHVGERAFEDCKALSDIYMPAGVAHIGEMAFDGCRRLKSVTFERPAGWQGVLGDGGWFEPSESEITIPTEEVTDPSSAAKALKDTYVYYIWTR